MIYGFEKRASLTRELTLSDDHANAIANRDCVLHAIHCTIARCPLVLDTLSLQYLYYARRTRGF